ncbi:MAG: RecB family exonuclease [Desulfovibrionales bacterium]
MAQILLAGPSGRILTLHIYFGFHLDGSAYPDALLGQHASVGKVIVGPMGLLGILETRFGLTGKSTSFPVRIAQYKKRLESLGPGRFFSRSYAVDQWSTAKKLLTWRDRLVLAGWDGTGNQAPPRIVDLATLEDESLGPLAPGLGERLSQVKARLQKGPVQGISAITLVDDRDLLPPAWSSLLTLLADAGIPCTSLEPNTGESDPFLAKVKRAVADCTKPTGLPRNENSLVLLKGRDESVVAEAVACWLEHQTGKEAEELVVIRNSGSRLLDRALARRGLPRLGHETRSRWRAALQVLPAIIATKWDPLDPGALMEFLDLPSSPLPRRALVHFRKALLEHPGLGGPKWQEAEEKALLALEEALDQDGLSADQKKQKMSRFRKDLEFYLGGALYDPEQGMPVPVVNEICTRVVQWATARASVSDNFLLITAAGIARDLQEAVSSSGSSSIPRIQLELILESVSEAGAANPAVFPEAASWSFVDGPGQIWDRAERVLWWNFSMPSLPHEDFLLTAVEREWLAQHHIHLETQSDRLRRESTSWRNPLFQAGKQLVFATWEQDSGTEIPAHPLLHEIQQSIGSTLSVVRAEDILTGSSPSLLGRKIPRRPVPPRTFPEPVTTWQIPPGTVWQRDRESFTSMDMLLRCPLAWLFRYGVGLHGPDLPLVPDAQRMVGTLCHAVVENLFLEDTTWSPGAAETRALELFDGLIPQMAASLRLPGSEVLFNRYRGRAGRAARMLVELINTAGLRVCSCESSHERPFANGKTFYGKIDLLLEDKNGTPVFWDLKWTRWAKYKRSELEEGTALQLAAYGWLLSGPEGEYPPGGYFLLSHGELISVACDGLPDHCICSENNLKDLWDTAQKKCAETFQELKSGTARVPGLVEPDSPSEEEIALPANCKRCDFTTLCGVSK